MLSTAALLVSACGDGQTSSDAAPTSAEPGVQAPTTSAVPWLSVSEAVSATAIAQVLCDEAPTRMGADAEVLTAESWRCARGGRGIRVDLFQDLAQQDEALAVMAGVYSDMGDSRALSELPIVCGHAWMVGVAFNSTRDEAIVELTEAAIPASLC